jgi:hypothetical protein
MGWTGHGVSWTWAGHAMTCSAYGLAWPWTGLDMGWFCLPMFCAGHRLGRPNPVWFMGLSGHVLVWPSPGLAMYRGGHGMG